MSRHPVLRRWRRGLLALGAVCALAIASSPPVAAQASDEGDVLVVDPDDRSTPLAEGGSATWFTLRLPDRASCPGDTRFDDWRVSSFIIPIEDDPAELVITAMGPEGEDQWPLVMPSQTRAYMNNPTLANNEPGSPGLIIEPPPLSFEDFPPGTLAPGHYRIGVVCSLLGASERYWDAEMELVADAADEPVGLRWRTLGAAAVASSADGDESSFSAVWFVVGGVAIAAAVGFVIIRNRARPEARPVEKVR